MMHTKLKEKLWAYIVMNNPDLMFRLQDEYNVVKYLEEKVSSVMPVALRLLEEGKPGHIIHELCLDKMTADLKPSRYNYILSVLSEDFKSVYEHLRESGLLTYEAVNLVENCNGIFDTLHFSTSNETDTKIRAAIREAVQQYFEKNSGLV